MKWRNDIDEGGKNLFENEFLKEQIKRLGLNIKHEYYKITNLKSGKHLADSYKSTKDNDLTVIVYNFVDMLSHSKTEMAVIKELADDDKAYRSLTKSWFQNSPLLEIIQKAQGLGQKLIITTDHGTINAKIPSKIMGDKNAKYESAGTKCIKSVFLNLGTVFISEFTYNSKNGPCSKGKISIEPRM